MSEQSSRGPASKPELLVPDQIISMFCIDPCVEMIDSLIHIEVQSSQYIHGFFL